MSEYVMIKKNGVDIASWCRSSHQFQALSSYVPFDRWETFTADKLDKGIGNLREKGDEYQKRLDDMNKILSNLHYEEALECLNDIRELRVEYESIQYAMTEVQVIKNVCEESVYSKEDPDHNIPIVLEWCRG